MAISYSAIMKRCCQSSSMKALPRIIKAPTKFQKLLWVLALFLGLSTAAYQLTLLLFSYFNFATTVSISTEVGAPPFPDVTICHLDSMWTFRVLERVLGKTVSLGRYNNNLGRLQNFFETGSYEWELLDELKGMPGYIQNDRSIHDDIDELRNVFIIECLVVSNWDPMKCIKDDGSPKTMSLSPFLDPKFGLCTTFSSDDPLMNELKLVVYLDNPYDTEQKNFDIMNTQINHANKVGAKVAIHPHGSSPDIWLGSQNVDAGTDVSFNVIGTKRSHLGYPYGLCIDGDEITQQNGHSNQHGHQCYRQCARDAVIRECGCLHIYYTSTQNDRDKIPLCGDIHIKNMSLTMQRLSCAHDVMEALDLVMEEACQCHNPCEQYTYTHGSTITSWPHPTYHMSFYEQYIEHKPYGDKFQGYKDLDQLARNITSYVSDKMISQLGLIRDNFVQIRILNHQRSFFHYQETPLVSQEALFGNVGGLMNLWAGITFITVIEVLDCLYQLITKSQAE